MSSFVRAPTGTTRRNRDGFGRRGRPAQQRAGPQAGRRRGGELVWGKSRFPDGGARGGSAVAAGALEALGGVRRDEVPRLALSRPPELCECDPMIGYARALTANSLSLQRDQLRAAGCDQLFEDRCGGSAVVRPALEQALASLAPGEALCVCRLDRLVWDTRDLMAFALTLADRDLHLVALAQDLDTRRDNGAFYAFAAMLEDHHRGISADRLAERRRGPQKRPASPASPSTTADES